MRSAFYPKDIEAVWQLADDRYVYIIQDPDRAGGAVCMIWVDDPVAEVARISGRGLEPVNVEQHDSVVHHPHRVDDRGLRHRWMVSTVPGIGSFSPVRGCW
ncbi:hypothetical protein [Dactylosporangium sp. NPDC050588]|uniref:hypothetical protein n=1 Tax=Dactylosporangium sp. NPDC050588 TaxID=3157211 RepID=UPI0033C2C555